MAALSLPPGKRELPPLALTVLLCGGELRVDMNNTKFDPPLDLQPPEGKEAEWALLRLAKIVGVECKYETWDELVSEISKRLKREDVAVERPR